MATVNASTKAKLIRGVTGQTGVTDSEALKALEAAGWRPEEAVQSIRARFNEVFRQRLQARQARQARMMASSAGSLT